VTEPADRSSDRGWASVVELRHVSKSFGPAPALADCSMAVPEGTITELLGPYGAGKTTAIRTITGALVPDGGEVRTFGLDPDRDGEDVRRRCGVVSAKPALYDRLTGRDNLQYAAELYGLGRHADDRIVETAARFGIDHALGQQVGGYSTGMKTRLALARSVLHRPELLLFDEPTSGLDPESSAAVLALIREMTGDGSTVVLCTHHLVEAEGLADQVVVLEDGHDLVAGTPAALSKRYWPAALLRLGVEDPVTSIVPAAGRAARSGGPAAGRPPRRLRGVLDLVAALVAQGAHHAGRAARPDARGPVLRVRRSAPALMAALQQRASRRSPDELEPRPHGGPDRAQAADRGQDFWVPMAILGAFSHRRAAHPARRSPPSATTRP
jgi:ABC-2 type transport system ATP-binding protein